MVIGKHRNKPLQRAMMSAGGVRSTIVHASEAALVKSDAPDTTFNYQAANLQLYSDGVFGATNTAHYMVLKFDNFLASNLITYPTATKVYNIILFRMGTPAPPNLAPIYASVDTNDRVVDFRVDYHIINEDFDCSAVTWNSLAALSTRSYYAGVTFRNFISRFKGGVSRTIRTPPGQDNFFYAGGWDSSTDDPTYGMFVKFNLTNGGNPWTLNWTLDNGIVSGADSAFFYTIEDSL